jgi:hypothetical protein
MSTPNYRILPPGAGKMVPLTILENFNTIELAQLANFSSESFGQIFADRNPMCLWGVFLHRQEVNGETMTGVTYERVVRDSAKRLEQLQQPEGFIFPIGAFWLKSPGDQFEYALLEAAIRYFPKDKQATLLGAIAEILKVEFGHPGVMLIDDAFE